MSFLVGDRVQVDTPDGDDPDHRYHGAAGEIEGVLQDDLGGITGNPRDDSLYRVAIDDEALGQMSFRYHDLDRVGTADEER